MATTLSLPDIQTVPDLTTEERTKILDILFEPSTELHKLSLRLLGNGQRYGSYELLIDAIAVQLVQLADSKSTTNISQLDSILGSHPRLGAKRVDSAQSQAEQAQLHGGNQEESKKLEALNAAYEEAFPGLRYVVFVAGRSRPDIMENMQTRINRHDIDEERREAIKAMADIAKDRVHNLVKK